MNLPLPCCLMLALLAAPLAAPTPALAQSRRYFAITTVDKATGGPLAGVRLETVHHLAFLSDDHGTIAFHEPGLMDRPVWFFVTRQGYEVPADFFGYRGLRLTPVEGGTARVELTKVGDPGPALAMGETQTQLIQGTVLDAARLFSVQVIDAQTGRGVPLVVLRSPNASYVTDSAGVAAVYEPGSWGAQVFFEVSSHGYRFESPDTRPGTELTLIEGGSAQIRLVRKNLAERLYRVTGAGIYRDSLRLGRPVPIASPALNAEVLGQDSVLSTVYRGRIFWVWGDTNRASYPLGCFAATSARSDLPESGGLDPSIGVNLEYFQAADGFAQAMAPLPGPGATWLEGLIAVPEATGGDRLFALYGKYQSLAAPSESGMMRFDDTARQFVKQVAFSTTQPVLPAGHAFRFQAGGRDYVHYGNGVRVPARAESLLDPTRYEVFTAYPEGGGEVVERDGDSRVVYRFKAGARAVGPEAVSAGQVSGDEVLFGRLEDPDSGAAMTPHNGSVNWNRWRQRFVRVVTESADSTAPSTLGEIWFAESDTPVGPFAFARKILTHDRYTFYNPRHHPFFDQAGGRVIYFEGTYSEFFSGSAATPLYDYNQLMHRLDLADARLALPVPVYETREEEQAPLHVTKRGLRPWHPSPRVAFFALDRAIAGAIPVYSTGSACSGRRLQVGGEADTPPMFWGLPADLENPPAATVILSSYRNPSTGAERWSTEESLEGWTRGPSRVRVWKNPSRIDFPVLDYLSPTLADAGPDQCVAAGASGQARVRLDSARSIGGDAVSSFDWSWTGAGGAGAASGASVDIDFSVGRTVVRLRATARDGTVTEDSTVVEVGDAPPDGGTAEAPEQPDAGRGATETSCSGCSAGAAAPLATGWSLLALWAFSRGRRGRGDSRSFASVATRAPVASRPPGPAGPRS